MRYELGRAYFDLGQFEKAQTELEAAVGIDPKSRESHYLLGRIYQHLGKSELAAQEFKITESLIRLHDAGGSGMSTAPGPGDAMTRRAIVNPSSSKNLAVAAFSLIMISSCVGCCTSSLFSTELISG